MFAATSGQQTKERGALSAPVLPSPGGLDVGFFDPYDTALALNSELENSALQQVQRLAKSATVAIPRLLVDIVECSEGLEVRIDLAGVKKEDSEWPPTLRPFRGSGAH